MWHDCGGNGADSNLPPRLRRECHEQNYYISRTCLARFDRLRPSVGQRTFVERSYTRQRHDDRNGRRERCKRIHRCARGQRNRSGARRHSRRHAQTRLCLWHVLRTRVAGHWSAHAPTCRSVRSAERDDVRGTLQLAVAANHARAVSSLLEDEASDLGAEQTATTIGSEEVSKTIVDTEARIRSREELRDRLLEVLKTRRGSVEELVEAERQVAAVNEEIDQAKSWLAETQGRVAFSRMDIDYAPRAAVASGFTAPIASAFGSLGTVMGYVIAALILLGAVLAPVAGIAWIVRTLDRRKAGVEQGA
ncbi:MAG: hypothetical protein DI637_04375 [Citromicrobium sp.]|nr:MAG: hypothetical protein DI637_04375 [Citromicrobium sp.]